MNENASSGTVEFFDSLFDGFYQVTIASDAAEQHHDSPHQSGVSCPPMQGARVVGFMT